MNKLTVSLFLLLLSVNVFSAWDGTVTGKIDHVDVAVQNGNNAGFRVHLVGAPKMCGNEHTWAYVNKSDDNYQTAVSVLLAAKMSEKTVTIYSNLNSNWGDYCQIGYVVLK